MILLLFTQLSIVNSYSLVVLFFLIVINNIKFHFLELILLLFNYLESFFYKLYLGHTYLESNQNFYFFFNWLYSDLWIFLFYLYFRNVLKLINKNLIRQRFTVKNFCILINDLLLINNIIRYFLFYYHLRLQYLRNGLINICLFSNY